MGLGRQLMFHFHKWEKWSAPIPATKTHYPARYLGEWSLNIEPRIIKTKIQTRSCQTCGEFEEREV